MPEDSAVAAVAHYSPRQRKLAVGVVAMVLALDILDGTIVNVAVPSIQHGLHASDSAIQWVISGYALAFALLLVNAGRLGDSVGYRQMFIAGVTGFTLASVLCGCAWSPGSLIAARVLQGAMAAVMAPQGGAVVQILYRPHERVAVMGLFGTVGGVSAVLGPVIGGLLLHANFFGLAWRPIFLVNAPIGVLAVLGALALLPSGRSPQPRKPDVAGSALLMSALFLLAFPLVQGREFHWPGWIFVMLASSGPVLAAFWWHILRRDARNGAALVPPRLLCEKVFATGLWLNLLFQLAIGGYLLSYTLFLQLGLGYSAIETALTTVPFAAAVGLCIGVVSRRMAARLGRRLISLGALTMAAGMVLLFAVVALAVRSDGGVVGLPWLLLPCVAVTGAGMGMVIGPMASIVLSNVDVRHAGAASGVLSSVQQFGQAAGVAGVGSVFFAALGGAKHHAAGFAHAFELALGCDIAFLLVVLGVSFALPAHGRFRAAGPGH